ncbi:aureocin A53 family class IId bacteriocin [Enterococcus faecium]|uniref:aureocin A53 family class IId bacteriocin n=1 Tax=Enterococcus TaxID=1350 RepID=UPI001C8C364B|nr:MULTISPECIES: aureocin A53 family class IId bacteriocin [Enterococcus]MBX9119733.1 aureocin A53 family class IId bacteriocin [Enterococcus faecium]MBX9128095.1 aureocin A53 family class IId bacteriocin [Enterococcus casseliflavus]
MAAIIKAVAKYGVKAVNWVKNNWKKIQHWLDIGMYIDWIVEQVKKAIGAK